MLVGHGDLLQKSIVVGCVCLFVCLFVCLIDLIDRLID